jgi:DNA-binding beta-propeller fold protein YncE
VVSDLTRWIDATIGVPGRPYRLAFSPNGSLLFVTLMEIRPKAGGGKIAVINTSSGSLVQIISCPGARGLAVAADNARLYVARSVGGVTMVGLDGAGRPRADAWTTACTLENGSTGMVAVTSDEAILVTSEERAQHLSILDGHAARAGVTQPLAYVPMGRNPVPVVIAPGDRWLFAGDQATPPSAPGRITAVDLTRVEAGELRPKVIARVPVGNCVRLALSAESNLVWATLRAEDTLAAFDASALRSGVRVERLAVTTGPAPVGLALDEVTGIVFVANSNRFRAPWTTGQTVMAIDAARSLEGRDGRLGEIRVGAFPREVAVHHPLFAVANFGSATVTLGRTM